MSLILKARVTTLDRQTLGGIIVCGLLAITATFISALSSVSAMLLVLVFGLCCRALLPKQIALIRTGVDFSAKAILRIGVALLGLRVVASDVADLGWRIFALVIISLVITLAGGYFLARLARQPRDLSAIAATSVAVCGASAALAASCAVPKRNGIEAETTLVIIVVSLLSTIVMVTYPWLATMLGFGPHDAAALIGAAIHDVAQVAGAGFSMSTSIGAEAVTVKMIRVACLLPVVMTVGFLMLKGQSRNTGDSVSYTIPPFLIAFIAFAIISSTGLIPSVVSKAGSAAANWALIIAVAGLGLKTSFADLRTAKVSLILTLSLQTLLQLATVITLILLMKQH
jgi:uncharacterized integral membrane protein (TIGR00698 family)